MTMKKLKKKIIEGNKYWEKIEVMKMNKKVNK